MKTLTRILIVSTSSLALLQTNPAFAGRTHKPLWSEEDAPATLAFVNPEDEHDPGSPARVEFVNPETEQPVAIAGSSFGDPDLNSEPAADFQTYLACKPAERLHPSQ